MWYYYDGGSGVGLAGYLAGLSGTSPTSTLDLGKLMVERDTNGIATYSNHLGMHRVQGDEDPWGHFTVEADYQLTDDWDVPAVNWHRDYRFDLTVTYPGYYDNACNFVIASVGSDVYQGNWGAYNDDDDVPFDTGVVTDAFPLSGGNPNLDAAKAGNGAYDLLMQIEVISTVVFCGSLSGQGSSCSGGGALQSAATALYYVEP